MPAAGPAHILRRPVVTRAYLKTAALILALSLTPFVGTPALAKTSPISTGILNRNALSGHDPVAYFTVGKPVKGSKEFTTKYMGTTWLFSSAANRDAFVAAPEKYAPQYGGYCSYAVSKGYTASSDPEAWKIVDGKLYLNYDKDVQATWMKDIPSHIKAGDRNWPVILKK
jgi:YHS domain-containing protein